MAHLKNNHHLIVIRISDSSAVKALDKKTRETGTMHHDIPGAAQLAELGATPLLEPERFNATTVTKNGLRACVFQIAGTRTRVILALGSATHGHGDDADNTFVQLLHDTLKDHPVDAVSIADFARLLRSIDFLSATWRAIRGGSRQLRHGHSIIDTGSPTAESQFMMAAMQAIADARATVTRTVQGKMNAYKGGACPLSARSVPLGWSRDRNRKLLLARPLPAEQVRTIIEVLGDTTLSNADRVAAVGAAGLYSFDRSKRRRTGETVDQISNPTGLVARWYELLDVWATGNWVIDLRVPALLATSPTELPVETFQKGGELFWRMEFALPMPAGGWAPAADLERAIEVRDQRQARLGTRGGGTIGGARKPFCGLPPWEADGRQFVLKTGGHGAYELRHRPIERATEEQYIGHEMRRVARGWGRGKALEGRVAADIEAQALHQSVIDGLVSAATAGLPVAAGVKALLEHPTADVEAMRGALEDANRHARNAKRNASEARSEKLRRDYLREHETAQAEVDRLEASMLSVLGISQDRPVPTSIKQLAASLACVADVVDHVPGQLADALREVITDFRIRVKDEHTAIWQACLRVPVAGGVLTIGPATGVVATGRPRAKGLRRREALAARSGEAAELFMGEGLTIAEVARQVEIRTPRRVAQAVRDHLKSHGLSEGAACELVSAAPPSARAVVWGLIVGEAPAGIDLAWADHVRRTYLEFEVVTHHNRVSIRQGIEDLLAIVASHGGWVDESSLPDLANEAGISMTTLTYAIEGRHRRGRMIEPLLRRVDGGVALLACPHAGCRGWTTSVHILAEVPGRLLCGTCLRLPRLDGLTAAFPEDYRREGPRP